MKILVTGSKGFIGKNIITSLKSEGYEEIFEYDIDTEKSLLYKYTEECDFVFHLAGINRPEDNKKFMEGNFEFTSELLDCLKKSGNRAPILMSSSIQAKLNNPYGVSKKAGEELLFKYSEDTDTEVYVYRLPNLFGKWCRPNYNSVVATFCSNIANNKEIKINDPNSEITLCYIDDVVDEFINALRKNSNLSGRYCRVNCEYKVKVGYLAELIRGFRESRNNLMIPNTADRFIKKLYSTYLSYIPEKEFSYNLKMNIDKRGSFTEFIKTINCGQVSINVSKPGVTKGNHWHKTKNEKFLVVNGKGVIRFRRVDSDYIIEYKVSGEKLEVVDIPPGYTHSIENIGDSEMVTIMWCNELFNQEKPDTYFLEVL